MRWASRRARRAYAVGFAAAFGALVCAFGGLLLVDPDDPWWRYGGWWSLLAATFVLLLLSEALERLGARWERAERRASNEGDVS